MANHFAEIFTDTIEYVDGNAYVDCEFRRARMVYSGGSVPTFGNCQFDRCNWEFEASAHETMKYLAMLHSMGDDKLKRWLMREIKSTRF